MRLLLIGLEVCLLELQCCLHVAWLTISHTIARAHTPNTGPSTFPLSALLQSLMCSVEHPLSVFALRLAAQETRSRQVKDSTLRSGWSLGMESGQCIPSLHSSILEVRWRLRMESIKQSQTHPSVNINWLGHWLTSSQLFVFVWYSILSLYTTNICAHRWKQQSTNDHLGHMRHVAFRGILEDIYHEGCQECVHSFCGEGAKYLVQWLGEKILIDLYIALNFLCTVHKAHVLFSYIIIIVNKCSWVNFSLLSCSMKIFQHWNLPKSRY